MVLLHSPVIGEAAEPRPMEQELLVQALEEVLPEQQNQLGAAVPVPGHADAAPDAHAQRRLRDCLALQHG